MGKITGNKGEWSELYVLLRLLSTGKIYTADDKLCKIDSMFFPILKIIREDLEYIIKLNDIKIEIYINQKLNKEILMSEFETQADHLYQEILQGGNRAFSIPQIQSFMKIIKCSRLAAPSNTKTDITMQIHDIHTGYNPICGFSIKSNLGASPTLINASKSTNFVYEIIGLSDEQFNEINQIETNQKINDRMNRIFNDSTYVKFLQTNNDTFACNLTLIDSLLTSLISYCLLYHYRFGVTKLSDIIEMIEQDNPLNYPNEGFYEFKIKKFLCAAALGMTPSKNWSGQDDATGGYIVVNVDGDVLAYHIYNRNSFETYLLNNTKFERGSTSRHDYAQLYKKNGKMLLNLNLQVRFI